MSGVGFLVVVVKKDYEDLYRKFYEKHGLYTVFEMYAEGAMKEKSLYYLGLEGNSCIAFCSIIKEELIEKIMNDLIYEMGIFASGKGIAFVSPVSIIGGEASLKYLTRGQKIKNDVEKNSHEERKMIEQNNEYMLISVIIERGYSEMIIDVLNNVGINKATIIKARTVGKNSEEDFLGIAIASEKEIINVVVKQEDEEKVIKAIMKDAGMKSDARSAVFSLPIAKIIGV